MKYVKYGHGKWYPAGWRIIFDMNGILKLRETVAEQLRKACEKGLIK